MEPAHTRIERIRSVLLFRDRLRDEGVHDRVLAEAVQSGVWVRVARGAYASWKDWESLYPDEQHLARAIAIAHRIPNRRPVFSHSTAAVLLGLPGYLLKRERVHLTVPGAEHSRGSQTTVRHTAPLAEHEIVDVAGFRCTSLERTMLDVARSASPESGLVCLDAGLRRMFGREVATRQSAWREASLDGLGHLRGHRGVRVARRLIEFADGRADSPAESLSRLQLQRLGYAFEFQVEMHTELGDYRVDFEFRGLGVFGEVDGEQKYTDPELLGGLSTAQAVLREKRREDWLSGVGRARFVRWGFREAQSAEALGSRLRAFGVYPSP